MAMTDETRRLNTAAQAQIDSLMAQLGVASQPYQSNYKGYQNVLADDWKVDRSIPDGWKPTAVEFDPIKGKADSKGSGINLWDVLSGTLGQPSGLMTNFAYNQIDALKNLGSKKNDTGLGKEIFDVLIGKSLGGSLVQGAINGGKKQWENWTDDKWSWGDVPAVGFLNGMDKGWKRGTDIAKDHLGTKGKWSTAGVGIGLDIALDPLTYLTGGLSAATKARKVAEVAEIAKQASKLGISGKFKNAASFQEAAEAALRNRYASTPNLADKIVAKEMDKITQAVKTAANGAYNSNINKWGFGVPFSNKANVMVGEYGANSLLRRSEATVGLNTTQDLLRQAAGNNATRMGQLEEFAKSRYGIDALDQITKTQFDDLHSLMQPFMKSTSKGLPEVEVVSKVVEKAMPQADFDRLMKSFVDQNIPWKDVQKQLDNFMSVIGKDPKLRSTVGQVLAQRISNFWKAKPNKNFSGAANARKSESMAWASRFLMDSDTYKTVENTVKKVHPNGKPNPLVDSKEFYKNLANANKNPFNEMMNGRTGFEHWLDKKNIFDSRTLATGDKLVNSMGDHISDAHSARIGENAMYGKSLEELQKTVKKNNYTPDEMTQAIYAIEKHAPDSLGGKSWTPSARVQALADQLKPILKELGENEQAGGVLNSLRSNYFPHVVNKSQAVLDEMDDFIKRNPELNGLKSTSKFNNKRGTFQTLAQRDNFLERIEKAIQKETDPDKIKVLRKQQEHVADMFDTNVVSALQRRIKEGTRAKAMKAMQGELSKFGMMKTIEKGSRDSVPAGLKELDPEVAQKLGLGKGTHYMHPEVLKGLERVDEVFTNQGMNKAVRFVSAISDIWRPLVTYYKPAHYINNMIGNTFNNIAAGVHVRDVKNAAKLMKGYRSGKLTDAEMKIMKSAYKNNVISGGFLFDSKATYEFDVPTGIEKFAKMIGENKGITAVRKKGEVIDDVSRLANYINGLDKFGDSRKAAEQVRKYLFNYNELTNADRAMRVAVPFWNWTKRNIPLQMKLLMENPQFPLNVERFKQFMNYEEDGADWQKETGIKVPWSVKKTDKETGEKYDAEYYTSLPSPTNDLGQILHPKDFLSSINPAAKIMLETNFNKKMYTGQPISYGSDNVKAEDLIPYLISNMGVGKNAYDTATGKTNMFESIMGMLRPVSEVRE